MAVRRLTPEEIRAFEQENPRLKLMGLGRLLGELCEAVASGGGGGGTWGSITGLIDNQTDLVAYVNSLIAGGGVHVAADKAAFPTTGAAGIIYVALDTKYSWIWDAATTAYIQLKSDDMSLYLAKAGGTMTGDLTLKGDPTADLHAATKKYVDTAVDEIENNVLAFQGFVSATEPADDLREGNLWYKVATAQTTPDTAFPWDVYTYDGTAWGTTAAQYTPHALDLWSNLDDKHGYYYFGDAWNTLDFGGSSFDTDQFELVDGVVHIKDGVMGDVASVDGIEPDATTKNVELTRYITQAELEALQADPTTAEEGVRYMITDDSPETGKVVYAMFPDYSNWVEGDAYNLYELGTTSWTADKDGFIICSVAAYNSTAGVRISTVIIINGKITQRATSPSNGTVTANFRLMMPIKQGDVVQLQCLEGTATAMSLFYVPPIIRALAAQTTLRELSPLLIMGPPNHSARETASRISTNNGTWTVDRDGYVYCIIINTTGASTLLVRINGFVVGGITFSTTEAGAAYRNTFRVKKGDVVQLSSSVGITTNSGCFYVPPVLNPPQYIEEAPLIDYSTVEQDTGRRWIDGKTIYQKTIIGTVPADPGGITAFPHRIAWNWETGVNYVDTWIDQKFRLTYAANEHAQISGQIVGINNNDGSWGYDVYVGDSQVITHYHMVYNQVLLTRISGSVCHLTCWYTKL